MDTIGSRVRTRREELGIEISELARTVGLTRYALAKIESGETKDPKIPTIRSLSEALGVSSEWLLYGEVEGREKGRPELPATPQQWAHAIYDKFFSNSDLGPRDVEAGFEAFLELGDSPEVFRLIAQQLHALRGEREAGRREAQRERERAEGVAESEEVKGGDAQGAHARKGSARGGA